MRQLRSLQRLPVATEIDEQFIRRVYSSSAYLWGFGLLVCWGFGSLSAAIGWTIGSALSLSILRSLDYGIRKYFVPGSIDAQKKLAKLSFVKFGTVLGVLALLVWLGGRNFALVGSFCTGLVLTQGVIVMKTLAIMLLERFKN